jgi:hypothetical protein
LLLKNDTYVTNGEAQLKVPAGYLQGYKFAPLDVEEWRKGQALTEYGGARSGASVECGRLADVAAANGGLSKAAVVLGAMRGQAVALCRGNTLIYPREHVSAGAAAGRGCWPGLLVLTAEVNHD